MSVCHILERDILDEAAKLYRLPLNDDERRVIKDELLLKVIEVTNKNDLKKPRKQRFNLKDSTKKVHALDTILFYLSDLSFSYIGRESLAEKAECSNDIADAAIRILKESGLFFWTYLKNPHKKTNGYKTIVLFCQEHPIFNKVRDFMISQDFELESAFDTKEREEKIRKWIPEPKVRAKVDEAETLTLPTDTDDNSATTLSLPYLKQERTNKYSQMAHNLKEITNLSTEVHNSTLSVQLNAQLRNIVRYLTYKIMDAINRGTDISHLSSYCEKVFTKELERTNRMESEARKQAFKQQVLPVKEDKPVVASTTPIPFVNWLEDDYSEVPLLQAKPASTDTLKPGIIKYVSLFHNTCSEDYIQFNNLVIQEATKLGINEHTSITSVLETIKNICPVTYSNLEYKLLCFVRKHNFFNTSKDSLDDVI